MYGLTIAFLMIVAAGLGLGAATRWQAALERAERLARSRTAPGEVTGAEPSGPTKWRPVLRFTDEAGQEHSVRTGPRHREHWPRVGDRVTVRYDPGDPAWVEFDGEKYTGTATRGYAIAYGVWAAVIVLAIVLALIAGA